jgi:hypothetical protein
MEGIRRPRRSGMMVGRHWLAENGDTWYNV